MILLSFSSPSSNIVSIPSSLDLSKKPHVLTITISDSSGISVIVNCSFFKPPIKNSESTKFFEHPKLIRETFFLNRLRLYSALLIKPSK